MKTTNLQYHIVIRKEKNLYIADAPVLGISDYGKTKAEAKKNITNAIQCHIDGLMKNHEQIPTPEKKVYVDKTNISVSHSFRFA